MKKIDVALIIGLILTIIFSNVKVFAGQYNGIKTGVVRLHILANSDSIEDQTLKIAVRDKILLTSKNLFNGSKSVVETENIIKNHLDDFQNTAKKVITENGYSYDVKCELVNMYFEDREYDGFTMPAGNYDALRITIGKAEGHNWWCVMYPPLCIPAAMDIDKYKDNFTPEEINMMKNPQKYKVKFKVVELYDKLKKLIEGDDKKVAADKTID